MAYKQHFIEWFSGKQLPSYWTQTQSGTGTYEMADEVDGGFTIYPASSNTNYSNINFNDIRQYAHNASCFIITWKMATFTGGASNIQMQSGKTDWNTDLYGTRLWSASDTHFELRSADASTVSETASDVVIDNNYHAWKFLIDGSDCKLTLDGVLKVTKTTNRPTVKLEPVCMVWNENGNRDKIHIRYMECYNT